MSDPLRRMMSRRLPPFPGSLSALTTATVVGGRPDTPGPGASRECETAYMDEVTIFLNSHPKLLDDYVKKNVSSPQIEEWLAQKTSCDSIYSTDENDISSSQLPTLQERYMTTYMIDLQKNLIHIIENEDDHLPLFFEVINVIGSAMNADGLCFYTVQSGGTELGLYTPYHDVPSKYEVLPAGPVGQGTTLAAFVAQTGKAMFLRDLLYDDRFPRGVGTEENLLQSIICAPLTLPSGDLIGVMQFTKRCEKCPFTDVNYQFAIALASWFGNALYLAQENSVLKKQPVLNDFLLEMSRVIFDDIIQMDILVKKIMIYTKELLQAERCALFLVDEKKKELYTNFIDEGEMKNNQPVFKSDIEIRVPISKGIVGLVAETGEVVNIKDAYQDSRFNREIDMKTGFTTRNILCMPIISKNHVIGVIQMLNRKNGDCFTNADESAFKMFSVFCALALHYSKVYAEIRHTTAQLKVAMEQMAYHTTVSDDETADILQRKPLLEPTELPSDLQSFYFYPKNEKLVAKLPHYFIYMVHDLVGPHCFDLSKLWHFTLTVRKNYRAVPYHNWIHGFNVAHCMYCMLTAVKHKGIFDKLWEKALIIATISHDVDHRGYNNAFTLKQENPLSMLYSTSVLEQHHYNHTISILQQANHNIFEGLSASDYKKILQYIRTAILATDLALYFNNRKDLGKIMLSSALDFNKTEHLELVISVMMTGADLVAVCKPFEIQEKTLECIYEEFYAQGDREKELGLKPLPMMDRNNKDSRPKEQVGFINFVCQPCYQILADIFPELNPLLQGCIDSRILWEAISEGKAAKVWKPQKSIVMNPDREQKNVNP